MRQRRDEGFTLIELLVVVLIIAILAAIAIPVFFEQREKGWVAQHQSSLKDAATAIETYAVENNGDYSALDGLAGCCGAGSAGEVLQSHGFVWPDYYTGANGFLNIQADGSAFCIAARHNLLTTSSDWRRSTYQSSEGAPQPVPDSCPNL